MKALLLGTALLSQMALAKTVVIDRKTPEIIPTEAIFVFPEIDWEKIEKRQDAGKRNEDNTVMQCDDHYAVLVEIKLPDFTGVTVDSDDCKLKGALVQDRDSNAWLQFEGPAGGSCTIKVMKEREGRKAPLVMTYEISDAC